MIKINFLASNCMKQLHAQGWQGKRKNSENSKVEAKPQRAKRQTSAGVLLACASFYKAGKTLDLFCN